MIFRPDTANPGYPEFGFFVKVQAGRDFLLHCLGVYLGKVPAKCRYSWCVGKQFSAKRLGARSNLGDISNLTQKTPRWLDSPKNPFNYLVLLEAWCRVSAKCIEVWRWVLATTNPMGDQSPHLGHRGGLRHSWALPYGPLTPLDPRHSE